MTTLYLKHPIVQTRRSGSTLQRVEFGEFTFEKRAAGDPEDDSKLVRSCHISLTHEGGVPVSYEELLALKLEEGIKRGARQIFGDIPE